MEQKFNEIENDLKKIENLTEGGAKHPEEALRLINQEVQGIKCTLFHLQEEVERRMTTINA